MTTATKPHVIISKHIVCPYCQGRAMLESSRVIYGEGRDYGAIWLCENFPAYNSHVGCHKGTMKPLGTMANGELRYLRKRVHMQFDPIWKDGDGYFRSYGARHLDSRDARKLGYRLLAQHLRIEVCDCHIGLFDVEQCRKALKFCEEIMVKN